MSTPALIVVLVFIFVIEASFSCEGGKPIDSCWRGDSNWGKNRMKLADYVVGFGSSAMGGARGAFYTITSSDDDPVNPAPGTLRYGTTQKDPLWIIFAGDFQIKPKMHIFIAGQKTIDGRGANVHIGNGGPFFLVMEVSNVIIHGLHIQNCVTSVLGDVLISEFVGVVHVHPQDGDAITTHSSTNVWIDHNSLSNYADSLIDVMLASTRVTISNNHFFNQHKVSILSTIPTCMS